MTSRCKISYTQSRIDKVNKEKYTLNIMFKREGEKICFTFVQYLQEQLWELLII